MMYGIQKGVGGGGGNPSAINKFALLRYLSEYHFQVMKIIVMYPRFTQETANNSEQVMRSPN